MRTIIFDGIIGADAEIKHNGGGDFILMRVVSHEYIGGQSDSDEYNEDSYWFDVVSSNESHIKLAQYLTKGRRVRITGKYNDGIYISKNGSGVNIARKVRAFDIELTGSRKQNSDTPDENKVIPGMEMNGIDANNNKEDLPF